MNVTESATGSGVKNLLNLNVATANKLLLDNAGNLSVAGTITATGAYYSGASIGVTCADVQSSTLGIVTGCVPSDANLKINVSPIENVLDKLSKLSAVYFDWDKDKYPYPILPDDETRQIGLLAQDFIPDFPELVTHNGDGTLGLRYNRFTAVLLEAIKELNQKIDSKTGAVGDGSVVGVDTKSLLASLGMFLENGVVRISELIADKATIKKLQMIDSATGDVYCTWIENGEWQKARGDCDSIGNQPVILQEQNLEDGSSSSG
ncbi:MAG: tail fiber domain-containing protein, partial [Patescibacteria group bacterium]